MSEQTNDRKTMGGFRCLECGMWRPDEAAEDPAWHALACSRFVAPTPAETPAPSQLDAARFMDNQKPSPAPERPSTSIEAARRHHAAHGDMDGTTCLLSACALHYPQPAPETLDGLSDEACEKIGMAWHMQYIARANTMSACRQAVRDAAQEVLSPAFAAIRQQVEALESERDYLHKFRLGVMCEWCRGTGEDADEDGRSACSVCNGSGLQQDVWKIRAEKAQQQVETLTAERDSWRRVAETLQVEVNSERDRRVAAQEAITLHWQPKLTEADAARQAIEQAARTAIVKLDKCNFYGPADQARDALDKLRSLLPPPDEAETPKSR